MKQQNALFLSECILCRCAVHNAGVGFTLKKAGETGVEVKTQTQNTTTDNIRLYEAVSSVKRI